MNKLTTKEDISNLLTASISSIAFDEILKLSIPYICPFIFEPVDWTPLKNLNTQFTRFDIPRPADEDVCQFTTFLVDHAERNRAYASAKAAR